MISLLHVVTISVEGNWSAKKSSIFIESVASWIIKRNFLESNVDTLLRGILLGTPYLCSCLIT